MMVIGFCSTMAFSELYLYDDFSGSSIDTNLWTLDYGGAGVPAPGIDTSTQSASLSLDYAVANKYMRIIMNTPVVLTTETPTERLTWDMHVYYNGQAYFNGIAIGVNHSQRVLAGQVGQNTSIGGLFFNNTTNSPTAGSLYVRHHYDYTVG
ncbi:MAG: hypothetical protein JXA11_04635 [Phycisphaerae bacterium]|nr:hypothetical protein [Phycisphaerae bacterium]